MARHKPPKVMLAHRSPEEAEPTMSTLLELGRLTIEACEGIDWLDRIHIAASANELSIEVRRASLPDSDQWGPSVTLAVDADGHYSLRGHLAQ